MLVSENDTDSIHIVMVIISHMIMKQNWKKEEMDRIKVSVSFASPEETHTTFEVPSSQPSDSLAHYIHPILKVIFNTFLLLWANTD